MQVPTQENEMITAARDGMVRHYQVSSGDRVTERELARHAGATHKLSVYNRSLFFKYLEYFDI